MGLPLNAQPSQATVSSGVKSVKLSVAPISGTYSGMVTQRPYTLRMVAWAPSSVVINGVTASYNAQGGPGTWRYDGSTLQVVVETGAVPTSQALNVIVQSASYNENLLYGLKGLIRRAVLSKRTLDPSWSTPGAQIVQVSSWAKLYFLPQKKQTSRPTLLMWPRWAGCCHHGPQRLALATSTAPFWGCVTCSSRRKTRLPRSSPRICGVLPIAASRHPAWHSGCAPTHCCKCDD